MLAADVGGTNSRLMLYRVEENEPIVKKQRAPGSLVFEKTYRNQRYSSMGAIMSAFLDDVQADAASKALPPVPPPKVACLAVAGVVTENQCRLTNLDWHIQGLQLSERFGIPRVEIINDFVAQGYGLLTLNSDEVEQLNDAMPRDGAPLACVGPRDRHVHVQPPRPEDRRVEERDVARRAEHDHGRAPPLHRAVHLRE